MSTWLVSALLVATLLCSSAPPRGVLPVLISTAAFPQRYGDSPQPIPVSRYYMTEGRSARFLLKKVEPKYPDEAKAAGVEGDVVFRIIIGKDGRVEEIHLLCGKPLLIKAAAKAVSQWRYKTYLFDNKPVEVETIATVRLRLPPGKHQ